MQSRKKFTTDDDFIICNLSDEDRSAYVELHRQLKGEHSLYLNPRSKDMMWEQILNNADSVFSVFTAKWEYCGSMELQHYDSNTPEIGIDLLENKRNQGIASKTIRLFAKKVFETRQVDYFLIRISSRNLHSMHVFEKMGAVKIGEERTYSSRIIEGFGETVESVGNLGKFRHLLGESDDETVYCYRLNPDTFL